MPRKNGAQRHERRWTISGWADLETVSFLRVFEASFPLRDRALILEGLDRLPCSSNLLRRFVHYWRAAFLKSALS